jgi:hypothetical protein
MSGFGNLNLNWNVDLDDEFNSGQQNEQRQRRRNTITGGSSLDWNMDLDDLMRDPVSPKAERRRHTYPATSLPSRRKSTGLTSSVRFGSITIRECERILGDNPACEKGPSLSIGWKYTTHKPIHVDEWEDFRCQHFRRSMQGLQLSTQKRLLVAKEAGYSQKHIDLNVELISYFSEERAETLKNLHKDPTEEHMLSATKVLSERELSEPNDELWC